MKICTDYRDGKLDEISVHDANEVRVNDCLAASCGAFVSVTISGGCEEVVVYLSPALAAELGNALRQLPVLEEA